MLLLLGVEDGRLRMDVVAGDVLLLEFIPLLLVVRTNGVVRDVGVPVKYFQYYYRDVIDINTEMKITTKTKYVKFVWKTMNSECMCSMYLY